MDAIVFDMDGVLIDSEPVHREVERRLFEDFGLPVDAEEHDQYMGTSAPDMFAAIAATHPEAWKTVGTTVDAMVREERARYAAALARGDVPVIHKAVAIARRAHSAGPHIAVASSAPRSQIDTVLAQTGLDEIVSCIRSADDVHHSKPDPEIYRATTACLGVPAARCWVIEDSEHGVSAAVAAGMRCIAYRNPSSGSPDLSRAEFVCDSMTAVAEVCLPISTSRETGR